MKLKFLIIFIILFIISTGCKDKWKYDFIKAIMNDPEKMFEYAKQNNIEIEKFKTDILKYKDIFKYLVQDIKSLNNQKWNFSVDKISDSSHRIKISNKENTDCINFYFGVNSETRIVLYIITNDNRMDPQDFDARGKCDPD